MPTLAEIRGVEYPNIEDLGENDPEPFEDTDDTETETENETPAPAADVPADGDESGEPETGETKPAEAEPDKAAEGDTGVEGAPSGSEKAKLFDEWADRWARDPVGFLKNFMGALTPEQQAQLTGQVQPAATAEPVTNQWEPQSVGEEWLAQHVATIEQLPAFSQAVQQEFSHRDQFIHNALVQNAVLEAKLDALLDLVDHKLPDPDLAAIQKALSDGKTDYKTSVKDYRTALGAAVKVSKQAVKPRPRTPANSAGDSVQPRKGASMVDIFRQLG